ncbi:TRAP transporter large permease [uncultured Veillonella sp.]|uniref:TRAP transporter large permease n=2 Tax=uncultured Veillonella sp. TaxID=159268 RepID=UPI00258296E9|nr:TRAP transporter large permease subunit [uncultured Veillonella sp.]
MGIIISLFIVFLIGVPIAFSLGIVSVTEILVDELPITVVIQKMFTGVDSIALTAIPLFILSGNIMYRGGMSRRIVNFAELLLGHLPSGLAIVSVFACMFFAAITGSAIAATAAIGGILIPLMVDKGYDKEFCAPLLACGGSIGPIIPPSIPLLVYGTLANVSVGKLFIGGIMPGLLMGLVLMVYCVYVGKRRNYIGNEKRAPLKDVLSAGKDATVALLMPVIIIGGIMSGIFTPTESAAIAVVYSVVVGKFVYNELTIKDAWETLVESAKSTGQVLMVVAFASLFTWVITINNIPQEIGEILSDVADNKYVLLMIINIILLIAGTFIDTTSAIVIFTPLFLPLVQTFDINLIHFGLVMAVNLTIGMCTPPLGVCLFVSGSIARVSLKEQFRDLMPMIGTLIIVLLLVTYIPDITLLLVDLL